MEGWAYWTCLSLTQNDSHKVYSLNLNNNQTVWWSRSNFIELLSTKICLAWNFFLDKNRTINKIYICCILLGTCIQLLFNYPENHVEIWLRNLVFIKAKFHALQVFMLSSSMKLGPGLFSDVMASYGSPLYFLPFINFSYYLKMFTQWLNNDMK